MGEKTNENDMITGPALEHLSGWLDCVLEENEEEIKRANGCIIYLKETTRKFVYNMVSKMSLAHKYGVGGIACKLIERYLTVNCHSPVASREHKQWTIKTWSIFKLIAFSAIILAAKNVDRNLPKNLEEFKKKFLLIYSNNEIISMEMDVLKAVDYKLPLWSTTDIAHTLAVKLKIPVPEPGHINVIADIADYNFYKFLTALTDAKQNPTNGRHKLPTLHLAAAVVVAYVQMFTSPITNVVVSQISKMVRGPDAYIELLASYIINALNE